MSVSEMLARYWESSAKRWGEAQAEAERLGMYDLATDAMIAAGAAQRRAAMHRANAPRVAIRKMPVGWWVRGVGWCPTRAVLDHCIGKRMGDR
jgi:hypothetical protein